MTFCHHCGSEVGDSAAFCRGCGEALSDEDIDEGKEISEVESSGVVDKPTVDVTEPEHSGAILHAVAAVLLAIFPAFGAYFVLSMAAGGEPIAGLFWLGIPVFGYLLYKRPTVKAMVGGAFFWLGIEAFLTPLMMLLLMVGAAMGMQSPFAQIGAAISGFFLVAFSFLVGLPVGIVFYLLSRRLDVDEGAVADAG